jgi:hypothetical protein
MIRAVVGFVVAALVVALAGAWLLGLEVDWGHGGIACSCKSAGFFLNVAFYGSALAAVAAVIGVTIARCSGHRVVRWLVITGISLLPYLLLADRFRNVQLLALLPCCVVAALVERWTRHPPPLPVATLMRS